MESVAIKTLDVVTPEVFNDVYRNKQPVVLKGTRQRGTTSNCRNSCYSGFSSFYVYLGHFVAGLTKNWSALSKWQNISYLKSKLKPERSKEPLPVFVAKDNTHFLAKGAVDIENMTIFQLINYIFEVNKSNEMQSRKRVYLRAALFEELRDDIVFPSFLLNENEKFSERLSALWLGTQGNITPLHFDLWHGLLIQIVGRKKVVIFHPDDYHNLYPHSSLSLNPHTSRIDVRKWEQSEDEQQKFPRLKNATKYSATLSPGDTLYIPPCWWHDVESLDDSISITLRWEIATYESIHPCAIK
jgi:hypothetical protein